MHRVKPVIVSNADKKIQFFFLFKIKFQVFLYTKNVYEYDSKIHEKIYENSNYINLNVVYFTS